MENFIFKQKYKNKYNTAISILKSILNSIRQIQYDINTKTGSKKSSILNNTGEKNSTPKYQYLRL